MKKIVALMMTFMLLFVLASCSGGKDTGANDQIENNSVDTLDTQDEADDGTTMTREELENTLPCEYVPEKLAAGMEVLVAYTTLTFDNSMALAIHQGVGQRFEELGCTYIGMETNSDDAVQIQQIENFVTMGVACMLIGASDPEVVKDALLKAEEAGTRVVFYGIDPSYTVAGTCNVDLAKMGRECGLMASDWIDQQYPNAGEDEIKTALFVYYAITEIGIISDGIREALAEDPRIDIVYIDEECLGIDSGFTSAEEAFTMEPNLKLICGYDMSACIGANNYIVSQPDVEMEQYAIFCTNTDSEVEKLLEASANNEGCLRGTIIGSTDSAETPFQVMYRILFDPECPYPYDVLEPLTALSSTGYEVHN